MAHGHLAVPQEYFQAQSSNYWEPPIVKTVAARAEGVAELLLKVEQHRQHLQDTGGLKARREGRARRAVISVMQQRLMEAALGAVDGAGGLNAVVERVASRQSDPHTEAARWLAHVLKA
jgi:LAO/AO transport system kinase